MNVLLKKLKDLFDLGDGRWFGVAVDRQWGDEEEFWVGDVVVFQMRASESEASGVQRALGRL